MKYLYYFKENNNLDDSNNFTLLFENDNWNITKANSFDSLLSWSEDGNINMNNTSSKTFSNLFLNTNKKSNDKIVLDFVRNDFYSIEDDDIYLKDFLSENKELFEFYGENLKCENIFKDGNDYWLIVDDYKFFVDYFKLDNNTRKNLIENILSDEGYSAEYSTVDFELSDQSIKITKDNLEMIQIVLIIEKLMNDEYDYDIDDISDYDDIVSIIDECDMVDLKNILLSCVCTGHERADENAAWNDVYDNIVSFFNVDDKSNKWDFYNGSKEQMLWFKFKTKNDAYNAKFTINKYDDSYEDDVIDYSPPYYGYSGNNKDINNSFNEDLDGRITEYDSADVNFDIIKEYYDIFKEQKEINSEIKVSDIIDNFKIYLDTKKFNL